jgi:RNA-binding protein
MNEPAAMKLTGKQARHLRGLGHSLRATVMLGRQDLSDTVITALDEALAAHELVKVKLQEGCLLDRREAAEQMAVATGSAVAQILGKTILFYRPSDKQLISLP